MNLRSFLLPLQDIAALMYILHCKSLVKNEQLLWLKNHTNILIRLMWISMHLDMCLTVVWSRGYGFYKASTNKYNHDFQQFVFVLERLDGHIWLMDSYTQSFKLNLFYIETTVISNIKWL